MSDYFSKILAVFPKEVRDNWIIIILLLIGAVYLYNYFKMKGSFGTDMMSSNDNSAYKKTSGQGQSQGQGPQPAEDIDSNNNGSFSNVGAGSQNMPLPSACNKPNMTNPGDLLPKDNNSQWAQLNPTGKGDLANINLLKAGYHIGIDTIGQTLRNANLQIRSEPPNPQINTGPWNLSTIEPDFLRVPMELGQGSQ
jgi:hypothetical protein